MSIGQLVRILNESSATIDRIENFQFNLQRQVNTNRSNANFLKTKINEDLLMLSQKVPDMTFFNKSDFKKDIPDMSADGSDVYKYARNISQPVSFGSQEFSSPFAEVKSPMSGSFNPTHGSVPYLDRITSDSGVLSMPMHERTKSSKSDDGRYSSTRGLFESSFKSRDDNSIDAFDVQVERSELNPGNLRCKINCISPPISHVNVKVRQGGQSPGLSPRVIQLNNVSMGSPQMQEAHIAQPSPVQLSESNAPVSAPPTPRSEDYSRQLFSSGNLRNTPLASSDSLFSSKYANNFGNAAKDQERNEDVLSTPRNPHAFTMKLPNKETLHLPVGRHLEDTGLTLISKNVDKRSSPVRKHHSKHRSHRHQIRSHASHTHGSKWRPTTSHNPFRLKDIPRLMSEADRQQDHHNVDMKSVPHEEEQTNSFKNSSVSKSDYSDGNEEFSCSMSTTPSSSFDVSYDAMSEIRDLKSCMESLIEELHKFDDFQSRNSTPVFYPVSRSQSLTPVSPIKRKRHRIVNTTTREIT